MRIDMQNDWQKYFESHLLRLPRGIEAFVLKNSKEGPDNKSLYIECPRCGHKDALMLFTGDVGDESIKVECQSQNACEVNLLEIIQRWSHKDRVLKRYNIFDVYINQNSEGEQCVVFNRKNREIESNFSLLAMEEYMKQYGLYKQWRLKREYIHIEYNPKESIIFKDINGIKKLNSYKSPFWRRENFKNPSVKIEKQDSLPKVFEEFFRFFVGYSEKSYEYLIDWLANSIQGRNLTVLCCIGSIEGLGKGVMDRFMSKVHGRENTLLTSDKIFKSQFNSSIQNKVWVAINEVHLKGEEQMNRFKSIIDSPIEIEGKGKDSVYINNFGNYLCFSNKSDAIKVEPSSRRWSVIDLGDVALKDATWWNKYEDDLNKFIENVLLDETNIDKLARYLYHKKITHNMLHPFTSSEKYESALESNLNEWQLFLVEDYAEKHRGEFVELKKVQEAICISCAMDKAPGRAKIADLCKSQIHMSWVDSNHIRGVKF